MTQKLSVKDLVGKNPSGIYLKSWETKEPFVRNVLAYTEACQERQEQKEIRQRVETGS